MIRCEACSTWTRQKKCPLCQTQLTDNEIEKEQSYPSYQGMKFGYRRAPDLAILAGIFIILTCLFINITVMPHYLWIFYVAGSVAYFVVSFNHTVLSKSHLGSKIVIQIVSLTLLLLLIDSRSGLLTWSVNYVFPFLIISGMIMITGIVLAKRIKWSSYFSFLIIMLTLGFIPSVLAAAGIATVIWPSALASAYAFSAIAVMLVFAQQSFLTQLGRRFHL